MQFLVDILPLGSGSVDSHIFADPDPGSQNLADPTDPDPKHWSINERTPKRPPLILFRKNFFLFPSVYLSNGRPGVESFFAKSLQIAENHKSK